MCQISYFEKLIFLTKSPLFTSSAHCFHEVCAKTHNPDNQHILTSQRALFNLTKCDILCQWFLLVHWCQALARGPASDGPLVLHSTSITNNSHRRITVFWIDFATWSEFEMLVHCVFEFDIPVLVSGSFGGCLICLLPNKCITHNIKNRKPSWLYTTGYKWCFQDHFKE